MSNIRGPNPLDALPVTAADLSDEQLTGSGQQGRAPTTGRSASQPATPADAVVRGAMPQPQRSTAAPARSSTAGQGEVVTPQLATDVQRLVSTMGPVQGAQAQVGDVDFAVAPGALFPMPGAEQVPTLQKIGTIMGGEDTAQQGGVCAYLNSTTAAASAYQQQSAKSATGVPYETAKASYQGVIDQVASGATAAPNFGPQGQQALGQFPGGDINDLVMWVLRESYLENMEDLRYYAQKVRQYNEMKKAVRDHLAELRKLQSSLAGVADDAKATTDLAGNNTAPAEQTAGGGAPVAATSDPLVASTADRQERYSAEINAKVAKYTAVDNLESYLRDTPGAKEELLSVVKYMTPEEVAKVLGAVGGGDMKLKDEEKEYWSQLTGAMTPSQTLELAAMQERGEFEARGQLTTPFAMAVDAATASVQTWTRSTTTTATPADGATAAPTTTAATVDYGALAGAYRTYATEQQALAAQPPPAPAPTATPAPTVPVPVAATGSGLAAAAAATGTIQRVQSTTEPPYVMATGEQVTSVDGLETEIKNLEEELNSIGDDAQLANVDLQNMLQKQQQTLQMMSNMSKMLHDTALAIIRKIGG